MYLRYIQKQFYYKGDYLDCNTYIACPQFRRMINGDAYKITVYEQDKIKVYKEKYYYWVRKNKLTEITYYFLGHNDIMHSISLILTDDMRHYYIWNQL